MSEKKNADTNLFGIVAPILSLGTPVVYHDTKGHKKAAFVVGTPETVEEGTNLPALSEGQLHLAVFTWGAGTYMPRLNVPYGPSVADNSEFQSEGKAVGIWDVS